MRKTMKFGFLALMVTALALAVGSSSMAFHEAAELKCMSCHTMHASENGSNVNVTSGNGFDAAPTGGVTAGGNAFLLVDDNATDLCLACHSAGGSASTFTDANGDAPPHVMSLGGSAAIALPGGDYWSSNQTHTGDAGRGGRGHNPYYSSSTSSSTIMWDDENYSTTDDRLPPGGSVTLSKWDCVSCHAPHQNDGGGSYGNANPTFRMLWSQPAGQGAGVTVTALESTLTADESDTNHTAYQDNFSEWCGQCHGNYHNDNISNTIHPSGELLPSTMRTAYNLNPSPGVGGDYSYLVPVEDTTATTADFDIGVNPRVMCMSCHRAHAASTNASLAAVNRDTRNVTRWDMEQASGSGTGCNKCHDKGE